MDTSLADLLLRREEHGRDGAVNQLDSAATPMATAFSSTPNYTLFNAVPNRTSLTLGHATEPSCGWDMVPAQDAAAQPSIVVPDSAKQVAVQWQQWKSQQHLTGPNAVPDYASPAQMIHFTWYDTHGVDDAVPWRVQDLRTGPGAGRLHSVVGLRRLTAG
jgi:hypothetical protein